jgi:hypothetical protein
MCTSAPKSEEGAADLLEAEAKVCSFLFFILVEIELL